MFADATIRIIEQPVLDPVEMLADIASVAALIAESDDPPLVDVCRAEYW